MNPRQLPPELRRAFEETHYQIHHQSPFTLRIGQLSPELDALLHASGHSCAAFITACNPMSEPLPDAENRARQQQLVDELMRQGHVCIPGLGQHPGNGWSGEESALVLGLPKSDALQIARTHRQWAFVWVALGQTAQLVESTA